MAKKTADGLQADSLRQLLAARCDVSHLRVRAHGVLLVIESGPEDDPVRHARVRRMGAHIWRLEMPGRADGWETTPFRGQLEEMLTLLETDFPWTLARVI